MRATRGASVERSRVWAFVPLFIGNAVFGPEMPGPWVRSINPVWMLALSGVLAFLFTRSIQTPMAGVH